MSNIIEILKSDEVVLAMAVMMIVLFITVIIMLARISFLNKRYTNFMRKIGNGKNLEEDLENYMYKVNRVSTQNLENSNKIKNIEEEIKKCIKKVGVIRYSAFKDTGSDLSFTLALLDDNNDGVVLNGIYSREMSNIYAKPVKNGKSEYTMSEEETKAIQKAITTDEIIK